MFNDLINARMLTRGAIFLAPIFLMGLLTGDPIWFRVEIVTVSMFIAAERAQLAPLGVILHALIMVAGFLAVIASLGHPVSFVVAAVLLAVACVGVTRQGTHMRWAGTFTFIPVFYIACVTANDAKAQDLARIGLETAPYLILAALPVLVDAIICHRRKRSAGGKYRPSTHAIRYIKETPADGWFEAVIAAALAVGIAASFVEWAGIHYAQWLVWSAASVVTGDIVTARAKFRDRAIGAIAGVPLGMLAGMLMPHTPLLLDVMTAATVLTLVAFNRYVVAFGTRCALHAVTLIVAGHAIMSADVRATNVVIGSAIGIVLVFGTNWTMRSAARWPVIRNSR